MISARITEVEISIHAPLTGCDNLKMLLQRAITGFQSTHPLRDATLISSCLMMQCLISIHAPLTGCDTNRRDRSIKTDISIHAPLTGCDLGSLLPVRLLSYFNPRTPYGMRLECWFYSYRYCSISIHAPLTGCDIISSVIYDGFTVFQSTHPLRDAT